MIGFREAQERILSLCAPLGAETIALAVALDRILAGDVRAREDLVPFARCAMDGFAVRALDTFAAPALLPVGGAIYAEPGTPSSHRAGTVTAVATGAPLPVGTDAVVPIEDVRIERGSVRILESVHAGKHVFPPGEDARRGDTLASAGTMLGPGVLGLLAFAGHAAVRVVRRPRVAIVCSGEELVATHETPGFGQIRDSNATLAAATVTRCGGATG